MDQRPELVPAHPGRAWVVSDRRRECSTLSSRLSGVLWFLSMEPKRAAHERWRAQLCWAPWLLVFACSCDKELLVGMCAVSETSEADAGNADAGSDGQAVELPWHSGFEVGFCDFRRDGGFCYQRGTASYSLVTSPVHSGSFAAAFKVSSDNGSPGTQARCVRQGRLPERAYYGAWYFVPEAPVTAGFWNLFHFLGQSSNGELPLWDVQLTQGSDDLIRLSIYDFLTPRQIDIPTAPPIPLGKWFHVEFLFGRATDGTGEIALYQDGDLLFDWTGTTDKADSEWEQWYVGSLAVGQAPKETTVYVDDVTIDATR